MEPSRKTLLLALILLMITAGLYWQTTHQDFSVVDDQDYVTENPWVNEGASWDATKWAFTTYHAANWHPLTWISHQIDWSLYGPFAGGHHLTNLILHSVNALLLFLLLRNLTGNLACSWIVAALFAWHPLRVESVAWVAERKDLLSTLCLLGSLWAYCRYSKSREDGLKSARIYYCLALVIFAAGLMSKPMIVTLPCLLLLLDYWPLGRLIGRNWLRLFVEKTPFFALSAAGCAATLAAQHSGGAIRSTVQVPLLLRGLNALSAYAQYLYQTIWPDALCIFYPLPESAPIAAASVGSLLLIGFTLLAWRQRKEYPWFITGWLWFVGSLVPVIGLVQVGSQAHADRYTYIPGIGLLFAAVWSVHKLFANSPGAKKIALGFTALSLMACSALTYRQVGYWQNSVILFSHALEHTANNAFSQNDLGVAYSQMGDGTNAMIHYREAMRLEPGNARARYNLGTELAKAGELDAAIDAFRQALKYSSDNESLLNNIGVVLARQGKFEEAIVQFREAIQSNPIYPKSYLNIGASYQELGQAGAAVTNYNISLQLDPGSIETLRHLAYLFANCPEAPYHQPEQAVRFAEQAVAITRNQGVKYLETLAGCYAAAGNFKAAVAASEQALRLAQEHQTPELLPKLQAELDAYRQGKNLQRDWRHDD